MQIPTSIFDFKLRPHAQLSHTDTVQLIATIGQKTIGNWARHQQRQQSQRRNYVQSVIPIHPPLLHSL